MCAEKMNTTLSERKCRSCNKEECTEKHRLYHCRNQIPEGLEKWEQRDKTAKEEEGSRRTI